MTSPPHRSVQSKPIKCSLVDSGLTNNINNLALQGQNENKPTRISSAKFSYSQVRPSAQNEAKPGSSLFDILRQSSLQLQRKPCTFGEESSQMSSAFASFKLEKTHMKKPIKTEGRFLI